MVYSEVVFCAQLREDFFDLGRLGVASGLRELDDWLLIVERFYRELFEPEIFLSIGVGELDPERRRSIDGHAAGGHFLAAGLKRYRLTVGEDNAPSRQRLACGHHDFNFGAFQGHHV